MGLNVIAYALQLVERTMPRKGKRKTITSEKKGHNTAMNNELQLSLTIFNFDNVMVSTYIFT